MQAPSSKLQLARMLNSGHLRSDDLVWREDKGAAIPVSGALALDESAEEKKVRLLASAAFPPCADSVSLFATNLPKQSYFTPRAFINITLCRQE